MPTELRRLSFSYMELGWAIMDYLRRNPLGYEIGQFASLKVVKEDPFILEGEVQTPSGRRAKQRYRGHLVQDALVHFCMGKAIPLARNAEKVLKATPDGVALDMVLRFYEARRGTGQIAGTTIAEILSGPR